MKKEEAEALLQRYMEGECSPEEAVMVEEWLHERQKNEAISLSAPELAESRQRMYGAINRRIHKQNGWNPRFWRAAAILLLVAGAGWLFYEYSENTGIPPHQEAAVLHDAYPASNGAVLRLANGKTIVLDSLGNGTLADANGVSVALNNGSLLYNAGDQESKEPEIHHLSTPRGRSFQITLPDGTKAWLNAASSIKYPSFFNGEKRQVETTGEVYFEVTRHVSMPFEVKTGNQSIQVLGTHFNILAYENEPAVKTTLMEGSVKILVGGESTMLIPGEQALYSGEKKIAVKKVDTEAEVAWMKGLFNFSGSDIRTVMQELSRWYDVDVVYEGTIPSRRFGGKIQRNLTLSQVLKVLEQSDIHYELQKGKLIIRP